jgi:hypothetical protein
MHHPNEQTFTLRLLLNLKKISPLYAFLTLTIIGIFVLTIKYFGIKEVYQPIVLEIKGKGWNEDYNSGPAGTELRSPWWLTQKISVGDKELDQTGKTNAEITKIESFGDAKPFTYLWINLKVINNERTGQKIFKGQPVTIGSEIQFSTPNTNIIGQVIAFNDLYKSPPKTILVKGMVRTIEPWILKQVMPGDKMVNLVNGETIAELVNFTTSDSPTIYFSNPDYYANLFLENNTRVKDVTATVKIKVTKTPSGYIFANRQILKVGQPITLYFPKYTFSYFEIQEIGLTE